MSSRKRCVPGCGYEVAETVHKTTRAFRLIVKHERRRQVDLFDQEASVYHVVASNWPAELKSGHEVLLRHNQRGQTENFHKGLKTGLRTGKDALRGVARECGPLSPRRARHDTRLWLTMLVLGP